MLEFPRLGSSKKSYAYVFSVPLKEDYARKAGITIEEANLRVDTLGAVIQDRLLRGIPSGIPYVGAIYVRFYRNRPFNAFNLNKMPSGHYDKQVIYPVFAVPHLHCSDVVKDAVKDNAPYTGDFKSLYKPTQEYAKEVKEINAMREKRMRPPKVGGYVHPTATAEGRRKRRIREARRKLARRKNGTYASTKEKEKYRLNGGGPKRTGGE